ncbi:hypothetical protein K32_36540 [Kaistia sp. 32K]|nr:hypothetical protein K32_36540 [Kaistia sp. 32K]
MKVRNAIAMKVGMTSRTRRTMKPSILGTRGGRAQRLRRLVQKQMTEAEGGVAAARSGIA